MPKYEHTLISFMLLGNFYCCKWPNIEQIVYPSGHTVLYHHHHELCNGCEREIRRRNRKTWMTSSSQFSYLEANVFLNVVAEKIDEELYVIANGIKFPFGKDDRKIKIDVGRFYYLARFNYCFSI